MLLMKFDYLKKKFYFSWEKLYVILLRCFMPLLGKVSFEWSAFLSEKVGLDPWQNFVGNLYLLFIVLIPVLPFSYFINYKKCLNACQTGVCSSTKGV